MSHAVVPLFGPRESEAELDLRSGELQVRLATDAVDVLAAQRLRYKVFYDEMHARPTPEMAAELRDFDRYDDVADHLLVIDRSLGRRGEVVGTYRLIRREAAARMGRFYTADEYDISRLIDYPGEVLELGRSCVHENYRNRPTMQLLWRGIAGYVSMHNIALLFGCASLPGIRPDELKLPLSYLYYHHLAPPALRARALVKRYVDMQMLPEAAIDPRKGLSSLPPLIKGYLRVGGFVGDGAVVDEQFNTTDVCVVVKTELITERYARHYDLSGRGV